MSIYKKFATDSTLEADKGVTIDYGDFKFTLRRAGGANKEYSKVFNDKYKPYRKMAEAGNLTDEIATRILVETYAETVIVGWDGITDEKGKKLPFNRENVIKVMTDLPELFNLVIEEATRLANFRKEEIESEAKNSVKS